MMCYEVLKGHIPNFGYSKSDWHVVIRGERPLITSILMHKILWEDVGILILLRSLELKVQYKMFQGWLRSSTKMVG